MQSSVKAEFSHGVVTVTITPQFIARIAIDEHVDAVGLSVLSGSHHELLGQTLDALRSLGGADIPVFMGGTIPPAEQQALFDLGARRIFTSDMPLADAASSIAEALR